MFPKTCASTLIEKIKRGAHQFLGIGKEDGIVIIQLYDDALMQSHDSRRVDCVNKNIRTCMLDKSHICWSMQRTQRNHFHQKAMETCIFFTEYSHGNLSARFKAMTCLSLCLPSESQRVQERELQTADAAVFHTRNHNQPNRPSSSSLRE